MKLAAGEISSRTAQLRYKPLFHTMLQILNRLIKKTALKIHGLKKCQELLNTVTLSPDQEVPEL